MRDRLVQKLPAMLDAAIAAYQQIAAAPHGDDPKNFTAAQTGAKAALAHIDQIIKLAEAALDREERTEHARPLETDQVQALIGLARKALKDEAPTEVLESDGRENEA